MRKLNRYGLLVLVVGLTILVLTLAQGCKGDTPGPSFDSTRTGELPATRPSVVATTVEP